MSFRYYIGKVSHKKRERIKEYSVERLGKMLKEDCVRPYDIAKEVYGLGSEFDPRPLETLMEPFYTNKNTHNDLAVGEDFFWILRKDGLAKLIEIYHEQIQNFMKEDEKKINKLITGTLDEFEIEKLKMSLKSKSSEWSDKSKLGYTPYNLDKSEDLINSWRYEYAIFQLADIYRNFDFKKNHLVIYGY